MCGLVASRNLAPLFPTEKAINPQVCALNWFKGGRNLKITSADIKNQDFNKSLRGYDKAEVDAFLDLVARDLEELIRENNSMKERLLEFESNAGSRKDVEKVIQEVFLSAKKSAEEVKRNAEKEAELWLREAKIKSERMLEQTHAVLSDLRKQIVELKNSKKSYILRLKSILETQLKILESMEKEHEPYKREPGTGGKLDRE
jgi:cell division initiation protein